MLSSDVCHRAALATYGGINEWWDFDESEDAWKLDPANMNVFHADRGHLGPGASADVVVIDTTRLTLESRYGEPCQYPDAVRHAFVNGEAVIIDGVSDVRRRSADHRQDRPAAEQHHQPADLRAGRRGRAASAPGHLPAARHVAG